MNVQEIRETMQNMAREMEKSGLVDEIIGDTLDSMDVYTYRYCLIKFKSILSPMPSIQPQI